MMGASWGPKGIIVFATRNTLHHVPAGGGEPVRLPGRGNQPHILQDGNTVLFSSQSADTEPALAALSLEDGTVTPLDQPGLAPHWVDGGYVVFVSPEGVLLTSRFDTHRMRLVGTPRPIQEAVFDGMYRGGGSGWVHLGVSRTGAFVYLGDQDLLSELVMVDREGRETTVSWAEPARYGFPRFSPDGRQLTVEIAHPSSSNAGDIWKLDLSLRTPGQLTFNTSSAYPELTPDGSRVVYSRFVGLGDWDLFWVGVDGSSPETLLVRPGYQWLGVVTPDLQTLVFMQNLDGNNLWTVPLDSSAPARRLTASRFEERAPALSPDGRWVAYTGRDTGQDEVYVRNLLDSDTREIVSSDGGREPVWGPNGRELFFRSVNGDTLYVVSVTPGDEFDRGAARPLWGRRGFAINQFQANYDVHPDGKRFIFIRDRTRDVQEIKVVLNWFEQLNNQ